MILHFQNNSQESTTGILRLPGAFANIYKEFASSIKKVNLTKKYFLSK